MPPRQLDEFESPASIFGDYIYFSSFSDSWLDHAQAYAAAMVARFGLGASSSVVEVASNDGYLLQYFKRLGIGVLGIEPAANVAAVAREKGIPSEVAFFGAETATRLRASGVVADLMAANNVLAHVPDINDFVEGFRILLAPEGVVTLEFPHLLNLMRHGQFDTIYHEHFSYLSLHVVQRILAARSLRVFDVEQLTTHGGSLRVYACQDAAATHAEAPGVAEVLGLEQAAGLETAQTYDAFAATRSMRRAKVALLRFLVDAYAPPARPSPPMAPRPRATPCSTTAVSAPNSSPSPSTAAPTSKAPCCPASASRSARPRPSSRRSPTTS